MKVRALLIDDEPLARRELRRLLTRHADVIEIVGEAANIEEAAERIDALAPGLLFLDIEMPGGTGFDLLARIENPPRTIFTTAYDQHALRAFDVNALDYLLKPIEPERLAAAIAKVPPGSSAPAASGGPTERLFIRDGERCWLVPMQEVRLIESDGNYSRLYWKAQQPMLARSLVTLEEGLDPKSFFRANRKQVIHLDFIESVHMGIGGRIDVTLRGGPEIEISRRQARLFRERYKGKA
ncbi:MAG TPA: LytTR family DNA-binding domain-containing protein [Labilithrix sp.]|nr:LytTR family DNA-binding domain-containing protein [Labilithrix sp.]